VASSRNRIVLPADLYSDIKTELHYDEAQGIVTENRIQDVEPYLDANKREQSLNLNKRYESELFNKVARIPNIVIEKWLREEGLDIFNPDHEQRLLRKLNDPEFAHLRTRGGKL
jgi:hypothetical protein